MSQYPIQFSIHRWQTKFPKQANLSQNLVSFCHRNINSLSQRILRHRDRHRSMDRPRSLQSRRNRHECVECFRRRPCSASYPPFPSFPLSAPFLTSFPLSCHGLHGQGGGGVELMVRHFKPAFTHRSHFMAHYCANCSNFG